MEFQNATSAEPSWRASGAELEFLLMFQCKVTVRAVRWKCANVNTVVIPSAFCCAQKTEQNKHNTYSVDSIQFVLFV